MFYRVFSKVCLGFFVGFLFITSRVLAQDSTSVRIMSANLNGDAQTYQPFALRIFQGLKPDVVAIQEFNYNNNTPADFRSMLDTAFGTNFVYFREANSGYSIPNGIISRYPIVNFGSWPDAEQSQPNRGFAWAQIDLPGTNDLYIVSVHLLTSTATARGNEAAALKSLIQANFPAGAWVVVAGDFNTDSRTESAMVTFDTFLSDNPIPADNNGNSFTSQNRNHPHDYVLPSFSMTNSETASVFPSHSFASGLVFDSTVYTPLSDVVPVQFGDSTNAQHMGVIKDFLVSGSDSTNAPLIQSQPLDRTVPAGSNVLFSVSVSGTSPLSYQWYFDTNTLIARAVGGAFTVTNAQLANAGTYFLVITNNFGSVTSSIATLIVTNAAPSLTAQPQNQTVTAGNSATFSIAASGSAPLGYQWYFNTNTLIAGAVTNSLTITNAQLTNAGAYSVVVTNSAGSITSSVAILTVSTGASGIISQWNFNSTPPDGSTSTGNTSPSVGSGTASLAGGATATFATGDSSLDPAGSTDNSGWNTSTYPAQGTGNKTRGVQFNVSTVGRQNISVSWSSQCSNTGSKYARLQYSTNGADFVNFPTAVTNTTSFVAKTNSLAGIPGADNNPNFAFRIVAEFESTAINTANTNYVAANSPTSSYGTAGTLRYDMVTVSGSSIAATPPSPPFLSAPGVFSGNQFQFSVTGTVGSNYVIQVSTNLGASNWISIFTNTAPFTFIDSNANNFPQGFYRAIVAP